jgi:hypothetical protein
MYFDEGRFTLRPTFRLIVKRYRNATKYIRLKPLLYLSLLLQNVCSWQKLRQLV